MTASTPLPLGAESSCWGFDDLEVTGPPAFSSERTVGVLAGEVVDGRFEIRSSLGAGGSGAVFLALDKTLRREVALKMLWETNLSEQALLRFEREGVIAASLDHPGIVRVHSAGTWGGRPYIAYELVPGGQDLREAWVLLDLRRRVTLLRDAAHALGNAHARGVVHRDVKPENVLVDPSGRIRVTDFGLSWARSLGSLTRTGELFGTPVYMAPEQMTRKNKVRGSTADVWSLGVMLFEALTDELPFGGSAVEVLSRAPTQEPLSPRAFDPSVPADLEAICLRCLSKDPRRRFATGEDLAQALDAWLAGGRLEQRPRRPAWWVAAPLAVVGVTAALLVGTQFGEDTSPASTTTAPIRPASSSSVDSEPLEVVWALALAGKPRAALERCPRSVDPVRRAWLAAWAEDQAACEEALGAVTDRSQARALAWTLRAHVPDLTVPRDGRRDDAWTAIADGEENLARGHTWSAALAFEDARMSVCSVDVELASRLGLARVSLAQGALDRATELAKEALALTRHPLDQERVLSFMRTLADSPDEPADELRLGPHGGVWLTPARARASLRAREPDAAWAFLERALGERGAAPAVAGASFARAELDLCARGGDGAAGIFLARAVEQAASAVLGGDEEAAEDALKTLKLAARLRPGSPTLWIAKSQAELVDRDPEAALRAADRALRYTPGDPEALLARAHALFGHLDQVPPEEDEVEQDPGPLLYRARRARLEGRPRAGWADLRSKLLRAVDETVEAYRDAREAAPPGDRVASEARLAVARLLLERAQVTGERASIGVIQRELEPLLRRVDVDGLALGRVAASGPAEIGQDAYFLSLRALLLLARADSARHAEAYARFLEAGRFTSLLNTDDLERAARALAWAPELTDRFLSDHSGQVVVTPAGGAPLARALAGDLGRNAAQAAAAASEALATEPGNVAAHLLRARALSGMIRARGRSEFLTQDLEHDQRCARFGVSRSGAFSAALAREPALGQVLRDLESVSTLPDEDAVDDLEDAFDEVDGDLPDALKEAAEAACDLRQAEVGNPAKRVKRLRKAAEKALLVPLHAAPPGKAFELTRAQARGSRDGGSPAEATWIDLQRLGVALRLQAEIAEALGTPAEGLRRDAALFSSPGQQATTR